MFADVVYTTSHIEKIEKYKNIKTQIYRHNLLFICTDIKSYENSQDLCKLRNRFRESILIETKICS
jgi:hypothetical protein